MRNRYCVLPVSVMTRLGNGSLVGFEPVFGGEDVVEALVDARAFDDLGEAGGDDVVAQAHALALRVLLHVGADLVEPFLDAGEQLDVLALRDEVGAVDAHAGGLRLLVQQVHVGDQPVGAFAAGDVVRFLPEGGGVHADLRQEGVVLHRARRQRAVEIVDERDGLLVEGGFGVRARLLMRRLVRIVPIRNAIDHGPLRASTCMREAPPRLAQATVARFGGGLKAVASRLNASPSSRGLSPGSIHPRAPVPA